MVSVAKSGSSQPSAVKSEGQKKSEGATVEVPAEAFALLFAWCFVSSPDVPKSFKAHPLWPANGKITKWGLVKALEPAWQAAVAKAEQPQ